MASVNWLEKPEVHDFPAAAEYLALLADPSTVKKLTKRLRSGSVEHKKAKDILRAAQLSLLPVDNPHVATDLAKIEKGQPLSPILLVLADPTFCAYNAWGGRNSYGYLCGADFGGAFPSTSAKRIPFGFQLSFERPLHGVWGNMPQTRELPFIQWMARRGIPIDVCTSRDLHFERPNPDDYSLLLFVGHHEYWTWETRTNVESFVKSGGNVAFFSGNVAWWQVRITPDGQQLHCYKVAEFDPVSTTPDHALTTVHFFDPPVKRPETTLTGVSWQGANILHGSSHKFVVKKADHWAFAGTNLANSIAARYWFIQCS